MHLTLSLLKASAENLFLLHLNSALLLRKKWISSSQRKTFQMSLWLWQVEESLSSSQLSVSTLMINLSHSVPFLSLHCPSRNSLSLCFLLQSNVLPLLSLCSGLEADFSYYWSLTLLTVLISHSVSVNITTISHCKWQINAE